MAAEREMGKVRVGLLGVGLMGSAMAARMIEDGIDVLAWDREGGHVRALAGVEVAETPEEVVAGAPIVITMLPTAQVVREVVEPLLATWPAGTIWVQMSSVGEDDAAAVYEVSA